MLEFQALKYRIAGSDFYIGLIPAKDFMAAYVIDQHSLDNPEGYQRVSKLIRSKRFGSFIANHGGFFHQTVLVNVRDQGSVSFSPVNGDYGTLTVNERLFVVDGQHRINGIKTLLDGEEGARFGDFPIPTIVMVGAPRKDEALQFFLVNQTHEGVRAELGDTLITKVINQEKLTPEFQREVLGSATKIPLVQQAVNLAEELNKNPGSIWRDRIAYTQEKLDENTVITQRGFTQTLKEVLRDKNIEAIFGEELPDALVDPLIDYWAAIHELCPLATGDQCKDHVLMKTSGAYIMHKLFPAVAVKCGDSLHQNRMRQLLENIEEMNDDDWQSNGKVGASGSGHKAYNFWVRRFTNRIAKAKS